MKFESEHTRWTPLERALRPLGADPGDWMYMGTAERTDIGDVLMYKHINSRHYLCLDRNGRAYSTYHDGAGYYARLNTLAAVLTAARI